MTKIPVMDDPMGKYWEQPPAMHETVLDDTHALLSPAHMQGLSSYSASLPSGVYPGKCWKAKERDGTWLLRWYGAETPEGMCKAYYREVLLVEG